MPKKYRVKIAAHAEADIEDIYHYIHRDSPRAASDFVAELTRQISSLERLPLRCPKIPEADELGVDYYQLIYGEYRTVFRVEGAVVYILCVIHGARLFNIDLPWLIGDPNWSIFSLSERLFPGKDVP